MEEMIGVFAIAKKQTLTDSYHADK